MMDDKITLRSPSWIHGDLRTERERRIKGRFRRKHRYLPDSSNLAWIDMHA